MKNKDITIPEAVIFDLDGVITQTRNVHKKAWRKLFDWFFQQENHHKQSSMSDEDYDIYIDGKPRYHGVESFLESRDIELPFGQPIEDAGSKSICALGNKKNAFFHQIIDQEGVEVFDDAIEKLIYWKSKGLKTAIVSSSKNCKKIIEKAGIDHLFDVRVDGTTSEAENLNGKPNPDIFLNAAKKLHCEPYRSVVFEDAISGVKAGQKGCFGLVVGVSRSNLHDQLLNNGADISINNFSELNLFDEKIQETFFSWQGEPVFSSDSKIFERIKTRKPAFFLDYDGTLTPIVSKPDQAIISDEMKKVLKKLAEKFTVAVVTGRDKENVEDLVGLDELIYAGSHGYIITGPDGLLMEHPDSKEIIPTLDKIEKEITEILEEKTEGTQIDRKRYAIGIHYRNARDEDEETVKKTVDQMIKKYPGHKAGAGKKILEIKPDKDWHKGKAVEWILKALNLNKEEVIPVFIGDDITDEDGFKQIKDDGIGILVGGHGQKTEAAYSLKNVFQVKEFFRKVLEVKTDEQNKF